jgi:putative endonuclease
MAPGDHIRLGIAGENVATRALRNEGYEIVARRFRTEIGELDIVARDGDYLVFVEVKTRRGDECGDGAEAVTPRKQSRIIRLAQYYLIMNGLYDKVLCRFDVVSIHAPPGLPPTVRIIKDAFQVPYGRFV